MESKKRITTKLIVLLVLTPLIIIVCLCVGYCFIETSDYLSAGDGNLTYQGSNYYYYDLYKGYSVEYHVNDCRLGDMNYSVAPEPNGIKVGYIRNMVRYKVDAYMLDGSEGNVIYAKYPVENLWLKEGYEFPDYFDAELGRIEIWKENWKWSASDREVISSFETPVTLKDILDKEKYLTTSGDEAMQYRWKRIIFCRLADINSLEIPVGLSLIDGELYLDVANHNYYDGTLQCEITHYAVKEEYVNLFMPLM